MPEDHTPTSPLDDVSLSELFKTVLGRYSGQNVPIGTLAAALHERGFGVLLILFSLPLCIPVPKPPPIDTILGIPLFYLALQMIMGRDTPTLPQRILNKTLPVDLLIKAFDKGQRYLEWFEKLFRPRLTRTISDHNLSRICGVLAIGLTCSVLVPFPMSNTVPSICMVIMAMGIMARDGLAAIIAGIAGITWVAMLIALVAFGAEKALSWGV
jgi:hypothetical protein